MNTSLLLSEIAETLTKHNISLNEFRINCDKSEMEIYINGIKANEGLENDSKH